MRISAFQRRWTDILGVFSGFRLWFPESTKSPLTLKTLWNPHRALLKPFKWFKPFHVSYEAPIELPVSLKHLSNPVEWTFHTRGPDPTHSKCVFFLWNRKESEAWVSKFSSLGLPKVGEIRCNNAFRDFSAGNGIYGWVIFCAKEIRAFFI